MGTLREGANSAFDPDSGISELVYAKIQAKIKADRSARMRLADMAYRLQLGLPLDAPLPKALGSTDGAASAKGIHLRATRRYAT